MRIKITISLIWSIVVLFAFFCGHLARDYPAERQIKAQQAYIAVIENQLKEYRDRCPTIKDIQRRVGAEPDGIVGPNTIAKWDKAICDQEASKWDFYYEGDKK